MDSKWFCFADESETHSARSGKYAVIPRGVDSKGTLMDVISVECDFPPYFGRNFDALLECLTDLSWIEQQPLTLIHKDCLSSLGGKDRRLYIEVLAEAVRVWERRGEQALKVLFPRACRAEVLSIVGNAK